MLGRELIPNHEWEHFPLTEVTSLAGVLVDGHVSKKGTGKLYLNSIQYTPSTLTFSVTLNNDGQTIVFSSPATSFGQYRLVQYQDTTLGLSIQLIFFASKLPFFTTNFNLGNVEFAIGAITYLDKKVFNINSASGDIKLTGKNGIEVQSDDNGIVISVSNQIPCPDTGDCPQINDPSIRTINRNFLNRRHVHIEGATHTVLPDYTNNSIRVTNNLTPCCDCEDQAPIWNAFVDELNRYNALISEVEDIENLYLELRTLLGNVTEDSCDIWKKIRDLHFPEGLFCRVS